MKNPYLVQLDPAINELRKIRTEHIIIPERLANTTLSATQKADLLSGKAVSLQDPNGNFVHLKIDLLHPRGSPCSVRFGKTRREKSPSLDSKLSDAEEKTVSRTSSVKIGR
ncbi:MAG: DUF3945 domain-containing protein [Cyclobacteriaceae bacterium]|nr:DUF3945 domain-containing protein [Cyclobacteriaceae bacterium]